MTSTPSRNSSAGTSTASSAFAATETLRFTPDPGAGSTTLDPKVLESAAADAAAALPQVAAAKAVLRGSAEAPDLLLHVHAEPSTHLPEITSTLTAAVAADVVQCLGLGDKIGNKAQEAHRRVQEGLR